MTHDTKNPWYVVSNQASIQWRQCLGLFGFVPRDQTYHFVNFKSPFRAFHVNDVNVWQGQKIKTKDYIFTFSHQVVWCGLIFCVHPKYPKHLEPVEVKQDHTLIGHERDPENKLLEVWFCKVNEVDGFSVFFLISEMWYKTSTSVKWFTNSVFLKLKLKLVKCEHLHLWNFVRCLWMSCGIFCCGVFTLIIYETSRLVDGNRWRLVKINKGPQFDDTLWRLPSEN